MVANTRLLDFTANDDTKYGSLVAIEAIDTISFPIQRVYYIYDVPVGERRGFHSHKALEQALICVSGSVMIHVSTPYESDEILLDRPEKGLYIGPMVWREMYQFSPGAVLLVLASEHYDVSDYIRDRSRYDEAARRYFTTGAEHSVESSNSK